PIFGHLDAHAMELGAIVYLNDIGPRAGGLLVWPGSHRLFQHAFDSAVHFLPTGLYKRALNLLQRYRPIALEGKRGDAFIFHNRLMHSNSYNQSRDIRYAILLDALGEGWKDIDAEYRQSSGRAAFRQTLAACKEIGLKEPTQSILRDLSLDPV